MCTRELEKREKLWHGYDRIKAMKKGLDNVKLKYPEMMTYID